MHSSDQDEQNQREKTAPAPLRDDIVIGRNPVLELLASDRPVECVYIQRGLAGTVLKIAAIAREKGIVIKDCAAIKLDHMCAGSRHQGVIAVTGAAEYCDIEDIFARAGDEPPFIVIADEIEDPHNLGAIIRSAEAAGAHGLILPKRRSAGLSFAVSKTSAGASEHLPVARVSNLVQTIEALKARGLWIYGAQAGGKSFRGTDFTGPCALVIGSEGKGLGRLVAEKCDFMVSIPMRGRMTSLNASVAAGIILFEIAAQRENASGEAAK